MRLTKEEIILISSLLAALVIGAAVQHWRTQARLRAGEAPAEVSSKK